MAAYQIFTDATADLAANMTGGLPDIKVIPMPVQMGEREYIYGPNGNISASEFYLQQRNGSFASTSQINPQVYFEHFEPCLRRGTDILYLCFSSGLSGTFQAARLVTEELQEEYPERKIICVDTLAASVGEGFLVREAARMQAEGLTIEELAEWVMMRRLKMCHWFTVDTFTHLKHGGRVSAATAAMGTALQIKPLLHVDDNGELKAVEKLRGRKRVIGALLAKMEQGWEPQLGKLVLIGHCDDPDAAGLLKEQIMDRFPDTDARIADIGPVIGAHSGPGTLALFYWGNNR